MKNIAYLILPKHKYLFPEIFRKRKVSSAKSFVDKKLGEKNYTHSPYPIMRSELIEWLNEFEKQSKNREMKTGFAFLPDDVKNIDSSITSFLKNRGWEINKGIPFGQVVALIKEYSHKLEEEQIIDCILSHTLISKETAMKISKAILEPKQP